VDTLTLPRLPFFSEGVCLPGTCCTVQVLHQSKARVWIRRRVNNHAERTPMPWKNKAIRSMISPIFPGTYAVVTPNTNNETGTNIKAPGVAASRRSSGTHRPCLNLRPRIIAMSANFPERTAPTEMLELDTPDIFF